MVLRQGIELIDVGCEYIEQFTLQLMIRSPGPDWSPRCIRAQTETARFYRKFSAFDQIEVEYGQAATAIWLPRLLMLKVIRHEGEDPIVRLGPGAVRAGMNHECPNLEMTAEGLGFSKRTPQRKLAHNGVDWSRLLDQVRLQRAIELLASNPMHERSQSDAVKKA